jgi:hypothetical protein
VLAEIVVDCIERCFPSVSVVSRVASMYHDDASTNSVVSARRVLGPRRFSSNRVWQDSGISFNHVVVECGWSGGRLFFDSTGIQYPAYDDGVEVFAEFFLYPGALERQELHALASTPLGWNKTFDRKIIPELQKCVHTCFGI